MQPKYGWLCGGNKKPDGGNPSGFLTIYLRKKLHRFDQSFLLAAQAIEGVDIRFCRGNDDVG